MSLPEYGRDDAAFEQDLMVQEIKQLQTEVARLEELLKAARHLLMAATGPEGGPTSWQETRLRWLEETASRKDE